MKVFLDKNPLKIKNRFMVETVVEAPTFPDLLLDEKSVYLGFGTLSDFGSALQKLALNFHNILELPEGDPRIDHFKAVLHREAQPLLGDEDIGMHPNSFYEHFEERFLGPEGWVTKFLKFNNEHIFGEK